MKNQWRMTALAGFISLSLTGCGGSSSSNNTNTNSVTTLEVPATYTFSSKLGTSESSVSYSGQVARQVLINDLNNLINSGLDTMIGSGQLTSANTTSDILALLNAYFEGGTDELGDQPITLTTDPGTLQNNYLDISGDKNLKAKIAGNDASTDHKNWTGGEFAGWEAGTTPEGLIQVWFGLIADNAKSQLDGTLRIDPINGANLKLYQTTDGLDLKQLVQKFLLGAVTFSQGADDYLDDDIEGKGILVDNINPDGEGKPYTKLEHHWDEGFGYFGAARDYNDYTDAEIKSPSYRDSNEDGAIDLNSEFNFGNSTNAAKRDIGSQEGATTDFTKTIFDAFLTGRAIINNAAGNALTDQEMTDLKAQRDIIVENWEKALSSTVVHYINEVSDDMEKFGTADYSYSDHIKHWGELKGFALGLQFNPRSPLNNGGLFAQLHTLLGTRPILPNAETATVNAYKQALLDARDILKDAYGFAEVNVENW